MLYLGMIWTSHQVALRQWKSTQDVDFDIDIDTMHEKLHTSVMLHVLMNVVAGLISNISSTWAQETTNVG
jgi:hypothetical protein